jgi:hypothetical protein
VYWNGSSFDLVQVDSTVDMSSREQGVYVFGVKAAFSFTDASSPGSVRVFGPFSSDQEALSKLPFEYLLYGVVHWNGSVLSVDDSGLGDFEVKYYTESKIDILKRLKDRPDLGMDNLGLSISKDEGADLPSIKIPNGGVAESNGVAYVVSEEKSLTVPGEEKNYFIRLVVVDDVFLPEITDDPGVWDPMRNGFYDSGDRRIVGHGLTQVMTGGESVYSCSNKGRYQVFLPSGWYRLKLYSGFGGGGQPGGGANGIYGGLGGVASSYDCGELIFYWDAGYLWVYRGGPGGKGTSGSNGHYASGSTAEYQYGGAGGGAGRGEASVVVGLCKTLEVETGVVGYTIAPHADNGVVGGDGFFSPVGAPGGSCEIWRLWR